MEYIGETCSELDKTKIKHRSKNNLSHQEIKAITSLKNKDSIMICKAGNNS